MLALIAERVEEFGVGEAGADGVDADACFAVF
jgi:hypothetical protein